MGGVVKGFKHLIACAAFAASVVPGAVMAADRPVFGNIYLGKTPVKEAVESLAEKGCQLSVKTATANGRKTGKYIAVGPECLGFPKSFQVSLMPDGDAFAVAMILYQKSFDDHDFKQLNQMLREKYGRPASSQIPFVGDKHVRWNAGGMVIELDEKHMQHYGTLSYMRPELRQRLDAGQKKAESRAQQRMKGSL